MLSETELLSMLQRGSHQAMEDIYLRYWEDVLDVAYKRVQDEEIAQEIFIIFFFTNEFVLLIRSRMLFT